MAKNRKQRRHSRPGTTIPLSLVAGFTPLVVNTWRIAKTGNFKSAANAMGAYLTGYDADNKYWSFDNLKGGLLPIIGGFMVHNVVGKRLGINRMLASAHVPLVRI